MRDIKPCVFIVEDDPRVSRLGGMIIALERTRYSTIFICSLFFNAELPDRPTRLVVDVRMPGQSGLELQRELTAANRHLPIIFITAHGDIPMTVRPMKASVIEFLTKLVRDQDLLDAIEAGLAHDHAFEKVKGAGSARFPSSAEWLTGSGWVRRSRNARDAFADLIRG